MGGRGNTWGLSKGSGKGIHFGLKAHTETRRLVSLAAVGVKSHTELTSLAHGLRHVEKNWL